MTHKKPIENQLHFLNYIHKEFSKDRDLPRKDFCTIEHLIRIGNKKLEDYGRPELKDIH